MPSSPAQPGPSQAHQRGPWMPGSKEGSPPSAAPPPPRYPHPRRRAPAHRSLPAPPLLDGGATPGSPSLETPAAAQHLTASLPPLHRLGWAARAGPNRKPACDRLAVGCGKRSGHHPGGTCSEMRALRSTAKCQTRLCPQQRSPARLGRRWNTADRTRMRHNRAPIHRTLHRPSVRRAKPAVVAGVD